MRIVAGLLCILLFAGCSGKDKIPSDVIDREKMGNILWDMMLADQYSAVYLVKDSSRINVKMETLKLYEDVFRLHKVTRDEFRKSFQFYQDRPDITRTLFDSLVARGNRLRIESYTHAPTSAVPPVSAVRPGGPPSATIPGHPNVPGAAGNKAINPTGVLPNRPNSIPPRRVFHGKDSTVNHERGFNFTPGRPAQLPPGGRPFLGPAGGRPLKAGEAPFKNAFKPVADSSRNKH